MATKKKKAPRRQYKDASGNKLPSVTTILGAVIAKPGLINWAAKVSAEATAEAILDGFCSREEAIAAGTKAPNSYRDHAANLGTIVHAMVEAHFAKEDIDIPTLDVELVEDCADRAIKAILERWDVEASEMALVSNLGFGGTFDLVCICKETGKRILVDLKTGSYHPEAIAQLAAYRDMWQQCNPQLPIDSAAILHVPIKDKGYTVVPVSDEALKYGWSLFMAAFSVYRLLPELKFDEVKA